MKRTVISIFCLFWICFSLYAQKSFSTVSSYLQSIVTEPVDSIILKVDSLVAATPDSLRSNVAGLAFNFFSESEIMGRDAVAVHIADSMFLNKRLEWSDPQTYPILYTYALFNRSSLIGMDSPDFFMESISGGMKSLREDTGHFKLVFFYDPQCSTCHKYSVSLAEMARKYSGGRLSVFAVNTGNDRQEWERYVKENFEGITTWKVDFYNLWDPEDSNDYHRKFGVLSTPAMLLMDSQNKIIGRRLDPDSAGQLLGFNNAAGKEIRTLLDDLFKACAPIDTAVISQIAHSLAVKAAEDSVMYRDFFYEMFNYLRDSPLYSYQEGAARVASEYILGSPQFWSSEYLSKVQRAIDAYRMNPLGSKAPSLILKDTLSANVDIFSHHRSKYTLLVFHIVNCGDCKREMKVLEANAVFLKDKKVRVVCIYAGKDDSLWRRFIAGHNPQWEYYSDITRSSRMGEKYDIEFVPKLYLLDRRGRIVAKDIDAATLCEYLK